MVFASFRAAALVTLRNRFEYALELAGVRLLGRASRHQLASAGPGVASSACWKGRQRRRPRGKVLSRAIARSRPCSPRSRTRRRLGHRAILVVREDRRPTNDTIAGVGHEYYTRRTSRIAPLACDQQCRWTRVQTQTLKNRLARSTTSQNATSAKASELLSKGVRDADILVVPIEGVDPNYRAKLWRRQKPPGQSSLREVKRRNSIPHPPLSASLCSQ